MVHPTDKPGPRERMGPRPVPDSRGAPADVAPEPPRRGSIPDLSGIPQGARKRPLTGRNSPEVDTEPKGWP